MSRKSRPRSDAGVEVYRIPYDGQGEIPSKDLVGSKAHNLMRMARRGLPVPPGFVLGTSLCRGYLGHGEKALAGLDEVLERELDQLATISGRRFGDPKRPLLVSVRSGAAISMPGMMETILNIGLTDTTLRGLVRLTGNPRLAADCRRRLVQQYAEVVHDVEAARFDAMLGAKLAEQQLTSAHELDSQALAELATSYGDVFEETIGEPIPDSPLAQLRAAVEAVVKSWMSERAQAYRKMNAIPDDIGTATIIQCMVFGNSGPTSGSGVGFTRNPSDGSKALYVDFLPNAQGEDVVSGRSNALGMEELERRAPDAHRQLLDTADLLEQEFHDMQDFEFTVEDGHLYLLQARSGKRTPLAALRIATDLVRENRIKPEAAIARLSGLDLDSIEEVELDPPAGTAPLARAIPASSGVATGVVVFDTDRVGAFKKDRKPVILIRDQAETADISALADAEALVTAHGARTSHAAVVARQLGKICLVGCHSLVIATDLRRATLGGAELKEGDVVTADGSTGLIYRGTIPIKRMKPKELLALASSWAKAGATA